nr:hypothetical protein [Tanacetum cinerariifolium]
MVKNLEAGVKFFMFPRVVQVFVNHQLGDMPLHKKIFVTPSLTKKVFANMKREGNGFSGIITPLFETMMVQAPEEVGEGSEVPTDTHHTPIVTQPSSSQPQKKQKSRRNQRKETKVPHTEPQTEESLPTTFNDPLPSGEDRMQLTELMNLCTNLKKQVLDLEKSKSAQVKEIVDLKKRVKKIERKKKSRTSGEENEEDMFGVNDLDGDEVIMDAIAGEEVKRSTKVAEKEVSIANPVTTVGEVVNIAEKFELTTVATTPKISKDKLTLTKTLIEIKATKPKARGVIVQEPSEFRITSSSQPSQLPQTKDKAKIDVDMELAQKLQTEEQEQLTDAKKARLFMEFLEKRRKFFARKREIKKRNKPPTKAQQRSLMCTYLKIINGWKPKNLKKKSFDEIQKLFDSVMKKVNTFVDMNTKIVEERSKKTQAEVTEGISKRARDELEQEIAKRQKLERG